MTQENLRIAVVGAGYWGPNLARNLSALEGCELVWCCDADESSRSLVDSDEIMFVIRGGDKRAIFEAAAKGENDLPVARLLRAARHKVTCFC